MMNMKYMVKFFELADGGADCEFQINTWLDSLPQTGWGSLAHLDIKPCDNGVFVVYAVSHKQIPDAPGKT